MLFRSIVTALAEKIIWKKITIWTLTMQEPQHPDLSA